MIYLDYSATTPVDERVLESFNKIVNGRVEVTVESSLKELGLDSLDVVEMLTDMEEKYGIEFDNDEMLELGTVNDVISVIEKKLKK